jgi:putative transposase
VTKARERLGKYHDWYNRRRPHSSLDDQTPDQAYFKSTSLPPNRSAV